MPGVTGNGGDAEPAPGAGSAPAPRQTAGRVPREIEAGRTSRGWWDANADDYQRDHGAFLGDAAFVWCPEGLDEAVAGLLGPVAGRRVLEVGCGAAQCSRWLRTAGADAIGVDLSYRQLQHARRLDDATDAPTVVVQGDATRLPFGSGVFDVACSAYGALPFVGDVDAVLAEVSRVLRTAGRWVFSVSHPVRWAFPDDPGPAGLVVSHSYFDRTPYVETDEAGNVTYVEYHRTLGDWIRAVRSAGFEVVDLIEPEWPTELRDSWGGWSPLRGTLLPGTAIFCCVKQT